MAIDRNAPCPCRSGLKYKKCCLLHPDRVEFSGMIGADYVDRDYVLKDLAARSDTMAQFRSALPDWLVNMLWVYYKPTLDANMRSLSGFGHCSIVVKQLPIPEDDFFDFAHEIGHAIMVLKGYPCCEIISGDQGLTGLGTVLTNTIMDPLVNKLVMRCQFDIQAYMEKGFRIQLPMIEKHPHDHLWDQHFLRCLCIEKILEWRLLAIPFENRFLPAFQKYHPKEYGFANSYADSLDMKQVSDPAYVRTVLTQLILDNHMEAIIRLV